MNNYIDITLLPDPEFEQNMLMGALFSKLHKGLVILGYGEVGISFPKLDKTPGARLRLHSNQQQLEKLMAQNWHEGLNDFTTISIVKEIPKTCKHRTISRAQSKSNVERLYRRSVKKGWLTEEEAKTKQQQHEDRFLALPFIRLKSSSSSQYFRLFIKQGELQDIPQHGKFSSYGLSSEATIPWF
jgi:CRISPR-associated endonuclease Csy4